MTRVIVCDTGPLLHLSEAGAIHLLSLAGEILVPPLVATEFEENSQGLDICNAYAPVAGSVSLPMIRVYRPPRSSVSEPGLSHGKQVLKISLPCSSIRSHLIEP